MEVSLVAIPTYPGAVITVVRSQQLPTGPIIPRSTAEDKLRLLEFEVKYHGNQYD